MRPISALAIIILVLSFFSHAEGSGRFDELVLHREGGAMGSIPLSIEDSEVSQELRTGWERFESRHDGSWTIYLDERTGMPALVSGRGIEWGAADSPRELEPRALAFLIENREMLGDWSGMIELDDDASFSARNGHRQLVFRQVVDGVRVENARLEFHVKQGRMVMMGASNWSRPMISGIPALDAAKARAALDEYLDAFSLGFEQASEPELVMIALENGHALIWRFGFRDAGSLWIGEVDAHDGSVRAFYDGTQNSAVRGGVFPRASDGDCATGGCEIAGFPMPFADYTEEGEPEEYADGFGHLTCSLPTASFETNLSGPYVNIADTCGAVSEFGTCDGGADLGMKHGENCDVGPGNSPGNSAAARTTFYHINRTMELARFYDPTNVWLQSPLTMNVNIASSCNANWDGSEVNMFGAGGNCRNTAEIQSILVHEWGHGYDHNDGGGIDKPGEAYADIVGILSTRESCMSRGMYIDGTTCDGYGNTCLSCTGFRDFDWEERSWNTPATPTGFAQNYCDPDYSVYGGPCRREAHCESYIATEAIYDLATRDLPAAGMDLATAWQLVERLWYETRPGSGGNAYRCLLPLSNSCDAGNWYQKMRVADDDDGDLENGTPHAAEMFAAFDRHDIACGSSGDAENQSTSSCPSLDAPVLNVTETVSGTELSWGAVTGAAEYRVYRGELGCNGQQIPIASLTGGETTYLDTIADQDLPRFYRVEVFGSNPACTSPLSNCEATPSGARLQNQGYRLAGSGHDGDDHPEPGETVELPVELFNTGVSPALAVGGEVQLLGPAHVRLLNGDALWPDLAPMAAAESNAPHFELVVLEEATCGDTIELDLTAWADGVPPFVETILVPMGDRERNFRDDYTVSIPSYTPTPETSTILIDQDRTLTELDVSVNIEHGDATQLIVELSSPGGTIVRLHDQSAGSGHGIVTRFDLVTAPDGPGTMADFEGESAQGTWTLSISDVDSDGPTGNGYLHDWTLHATVVGGFDCEPVTCPEPTPTEAPELTVDITGSDLVLDWTLVGGAPHHHVLQSAAPEFASGVVLLDRTTTETTHTITDGVATTPDLTFFQVRATNSCNLEGP